MLAGTLTDVARLDDLAGLAKWLLAAIEDGLTALGVTLPATPAFREPGRAVAWDGEQLAIAFQGCTVGIPGAPAMEAPQQPYLFATFNVLLLRYVPSLSNEGDNLYLPTPQQLDDAAPLTMGDASALAVWAAGFRASYPSTPMAFSIEAIGPQGQVAGTNLVLSVQVM